MELSKIVEQITNLILIILLAINKTSENKKNQLITQLSGCFGILEHWELMFYLTE